MITVDKITPSPSSDLRDFVESRSGQKVFRCYQCGKCTAGCPAAYVMDMGPRQIMHFIQLGQKELVLGSSTIWLCISCQTCSARCPNEIDIARVMESLRWLAAVERSDPAEKGIERFHRLFLTIIQRFGRIHELSLGVSYNMLGRQPFAKITSLPAMFARGKVPILPPRVKGAAEIRGLYAKVRAIEKEPAKGEVE